MSNQKEKGISKGYLYGVVLLTLVLPAGSVLAEWQMQGGGFNPVVLIGKWFVFWAVGFRLLLAGLRQVADPEFTARDIFHINDRASHALVRELGFANICFGIIGILSLFLPQWRDVSAFGSGLYYALAGAQHAIKRPAGGNEWIALISDVFIFLCLLIYLIATGL